MDGLNSDNAILGSTFASEHTRAARFAGGYSFAGTKRVANLSLTVSRGLDILGARAQPVISQAVFTKLNGRVSLDQAIGKHAVLRLRGSGQYTKDPLPAGERFAIGGPEFGRAFDISLITADRGVAGSAELAWRPVRGHIFAGSELYGFVDGARVRLVPRGYFLGADYGLASAGAGVRIAYTTKAVLALEAAAQPRPADPRLWRRLALLGRLAAVGRQMSALTRDRAGPTA